MSKPPATTKASGNRAETHTDSEAALEATARPNESDNTPVDHSSALVGLLLEWVQSHLGLISQSSKLVAADARLAATSAIQLFALAVLASLIALLTWVALMAAVTVLALKLGASIGLIVSLILIVHVVLLVLLMLAIRSTLAGIRFSASREWLSRNTTDKESHTDV